MMALEGYVVPIYRSLTEQVLIAGAPRRVTIINGTLAAVLGLGMHLVPMGIGFWVIAQSLSAYMTNRDPHFMEVARRHIRYRGYLAC